MKKEIICHVSMGALLWALGVGPVQAQSRQQPATANDQGAGDATQDIVVTAQRRSERLQDVPVSVTAIGGGALERQNIQGVREITRMVPSLVLGQSSSVVTPFLRGTGNSSSSAGNEASIPMFIDGVYYARLSTYLLKLNSVDHIEVLKGPQGTLFGRNSSGGLIHVLTKDPTDHLTADMSAGYSNYDTLDGAFYVAGPLGDKVRANLSVVGSRQGNGWGTNVVTGDDARKEEYVTTRAKLMADPWEGGEITLSAYYVWAKGDTTINGGDPVQGSTVGNPTSAPPMRYPALRGFYDYQATFPIVEYLHSYGFTGRLRQELPFATLVSISDYHRGNDHYFNDIDFTPTNYLNVDYSNKFNQFSQELQLVSPSGQRLKWTAGLYYLRSADGLLPADQWGLNFGANGLRIVSEQVVKSIAGYGQATYELADRFNVTLGMRYTRDDISAMGHLDSIRPSNPATARPDFTVLAPGAVVRGKDHFQKLTWKAGVDYKFTDHVLGYATVSTGYKSGVFNIVPFTNPVALKPEEMTAYELGLKSTLGPLRLNLAAYWYDQRNLQVGQTIATGSGLVAILTNAGKARNKGIEADGDLRLARGLSLNFGVAYADGRYKSYPGAQTTAENNQLVNGIVPLCSVPARTNINPANGGNVEFCPFDASGKRLIRAPVWSGNVGLSYHIDMADDAAWDFGTDAVFTGKFFWDPANRVTQANEVLLGANVRYQFAGGKPFVRLWGKNLLNKKYYAFVFPQSGPAGTGGVPAEPRRYGVTVGMKL